MKNIPAKVKCLKGSEQICNFVREDPRKILHLIEHENLPAWKRDGEQTWRALNIDLYYWLLSQRNKYLKNTLKYLENI